MLSLEEAIDKFKQKYPNSEIEGVCLFKNKYGFGCGADRCGLDEYDTRMIAIDRKTGDFCYIDVFDDPDILDDNICKTVWKKESK